MSLLHYKGLYFIVNVCIHYKSLYFITNISTSVPISLLHYKCLYFIVNVSTSLQMSLLHCKGLYFIKMSLIHYKCLYFITNVSTSLQISLRYYKFSTSLQMSLLHVARKQSLKDKTAFLWLKVCICAGHLTNNAICQTMRTTAFHVGKTYTIRVTSDLLYCTQLVGIQDLALNKFEDNSSNFTSLDFESCIILIYIYIYIYIYI